MVSLEEAGAAAADGSRRGHFSLFSVQRRLELIMHRICAESARIAHLPLRPSNSFRELLSAADVRKDFICEPAPLRTLITAIDIDSVASARSKGVKWPV